MNGVLGNMSVSEVEEVVEQLSEAGMISMEQGVIDGTTAEGQKQIEKLEKEAREEKERVEEEEKRRAREEEDQAEKAAYAEEDDPSYADALLDHVEQDEGLSFATCLARRKAARRAAEEGKAQEGKEGKEGEEGKTGEGKVKVADPE